jgi:hypothetical protein
MDRGRRQNHQCGRHGYTPVGRTLLRLLHSTLSARGRTAVRSCADELTRVRLEHEHIAAGIPGYDNLLKRDMVFAKHRESEGHVYDATSGIIDAALIFAEGASRQFHRNERHAVPEFLSRNPDFCPELLSVLARLRSNLTGRIGAGQTRGVWGEESSRGATSGLRTFRVTLWPRCWLRPAVTFRLIRTSD